MQKSLFALCLAALMLGTTSCNKKLGELTADQFTVTPTPLEAMNGQVPFIINGKFPEKYMKKKATIVVTPVLRYANGEQRGKSATFQGEKVMGNGQEVSYLLGGSYTMRDVFPYTDDMLRSELYMTFQAAVGKKVCVVPDVRIAHGVLATSQLASAAMRSSNPAIAEDAYQYAIAQTKQAQINYLIQQANIRTSELKKPSVEEFVEMLRMLKNDQKGLMLDGISIAAFASPDGSLALNERLAKERQNSSSKFLNNEMKKVGLEADIETSFTAEDWEGFQEIVSKSNLQDKEVILRVLSMYEDPEEREKQIHNLSAAFGELADLVLPELRRARLTLNYQVFGRTDDEIVEQYAADAAQLSVEELLYGATLVDDNAKATQIYTTCAKLYRSDYRAYNNLAACALQDGDLAKAKEWAELAANICPSSAEAAANNALIALIEGREADAETLLGAASTAKNYNELLGGLYLTQSHYKQAAEVLQGSNTNIAALAQILNKDYAAATKTLSAIKHPDAITDYLSAILSARTNQDAVALNALRAAFAKDPSLRQRAAQDLEFVNLFNDSAFQALVQ